MADPAPLTPIDVFVLCEVEPEAMLWELPAIRTNNGTDEERIAAVPQLRDAVVSLAGRGLIEVNDFPAWPTVPDQAIPISRPGLRSVLTPVHVWLWHGDDTSLLTVAITESGVTWLASHSWQ